MTQAAVDSFLTVISEITCQDIPQVKSVQCTCHKERNERFSHTAFVFYDALLRSMAKTVIFPSFHEKKVFNMRLTGVFPITRLPGGGREGGYLGFSYLKYFGRIFQTQTVNNRVVNLSSET